MKLKQQYSVEPVGATQAREFIRQWHYSGYCPPGRYYFGLVEREGNTIHGVAVFGRPPGAKTAKCYNPAAPERIIELRRLACIDNTPKNVESFLIGACLRELKSSGAYDACLSMADPSWGHSGVIYQASNFRYLGHEAGHGTRYFIIDGKRLHAKTAYDVYGFSGYNQLAATLGGDRVEMVIPPPKHVYLYPFAGIQKF